jgi:hypothetical protein
VLVDTPLAPYFSECISSEDLDEMNVEIMRNILYKVRVTSLSSDSLSSVFLAETVRSSKESCAHSLLLTMRRLI